MLLVKTMCSNKILMMAATKNMNSVDIFDDLPECYPVAE